MKKQLAVFASGTGTNFEAIARACADGVLDAEAKSRKYSDRALSAKSKYLE